MKIDLSIEPKRIILHTFQSPEVYDLLVNEKKVYRCNIDKSREVLNPFAKPGQRPEKLHRFLNAYKWMADQMKQRIGPPPEGVEYPVWAWYSLRGQRKLDFRWSEFQYRDEGYILQIQKDSKDILLSDEPMFYSVLNDWYINPGCNGDTYHLFENMYNALSYEEKQSEKVKSWEQIFVPPIPVKSVWTSYGLHMQATFWEIRPEEVIQTQYLKEKRFKS